MYGGVIHPIDNLTILCQRRHERQGNPFSDHHIPLCQEPDFEEILFNTRRTCVIEICETGPQRLKT